jgi:hypothetical protein
MEDQAAGDPQPVRQLPPHGLRGLHLGERGRDLPIRGPAGVLDQPIGLGAAGLLVFANPVHGLRPRQKGTPAERGRQPPGLSLPSSSCLPDQWMSHVVAIGEVMRP